MLKPLERYREAIAEKFPELSVSSLEYLSEGWDSVTCRVNKTLVFRFPKRKEVEIELLKEARLLPRLAPALPLPVPRFDYLSEKPGRAFPFAFAGYPLIKGRQLEECSPAVKSGDWWKAPLGDFLGALHAFPLDQAREAGVACFSLTQTEEKPGNWRETLQNFFSQFQVFAFPLLSPEKKSQLSGHFRTFLNDSRLFEFEPSLIHGDLSEEHVLLDLKSRRISGIIDFGDCGIGDPAYDVWDHLLPYYPRPLDPAWRQRRQFYNGLSPLQALLFGARHHDQALVSFGLYELDRLGFNNRQKPG